MEDNKKQNSEISNDAQNKYEQSKNKFYKYGKIFFLFGIIVCILLSMCLIATIGSIINDMCRYGYY